MVAGNLPVNWGSSNGWSSDFCSADALLPRTSPETISMVANAIAVRRSTRPRPKECWGSRERNDRSDLIQRRRVNQVGDPIDWHGGYRALIGEQVRFGSRYSSTSLLRMA